MKDKAVFFDRDGVLNVDVDYLYRIEDLVWVDGAREALAYLSNLGYKIFVVTNQSGVARGYYTIEDMNKLHAHMASELEKAGAKVVWAICSVTAKPPAPSMPSFWIWRSPRTISAVKRKSLATAIPRFLMSAGRTGSCR